MIFTLIYITVSTTRRIPTKHGYTVETIGNSGTSLQIEWQRLQEPWSENSGVLLYALFRKNKNKHRMDAISSRNPQAQMKPTTENCSVSPVAEATSLVEWSACHAMTLLPRPLWKTKKRGFRWVLLDLESERTGKYCLKTRELSMKAVHFEILNRICTKSVHLVWSTGTSLLLLLPKPGLWQQVSDRHRYNFWLF